MQPIDCNVIYFYIELMDNDCTVRGVSMLYKELIQNAVIRATPSEDATWPENINNVPLPPKKNPSSGFIWLFYQYILQQKHFFPLIWTQGAAILVHSIPIKSGKGFTHDVVYTSAVLAAFFMSWLLPHMAGSSCRHFCHIIMAAFFLSSLLPHLAAFFLSSFLPHLAAFFLSSFLPHLAASFLSSFLPHLAAFLLSSFLPHLAAFLLSSHIQTARHDCRGHSRVFPTFKCRFLTNQTIKWLKNCCNFLNINFPYKSIGPVVLLRLGSPLRVSVYGLLVHISCWRRGHWEVPAMRPRRSTGQHISTVWCHQRYLYIFICVDFFKFEMSICIVPLLYVEARNYVAWELYLVHFVTSSACRCPFPNTQMKAVTILREAVVGIFKFFVFQVFFHWYWCPFHFLFVCLLC